MDLNRIYNDVRSRFLASQKKKPQPKVDISNVSKRFHDFLKTQQKTAQPSARMIPTISQGTVAERFMGFLNSQKPSIDSVGKRFTEATGTTLRFLQDDIEKPMVNPMMTKPLGFEAPSIADVGRQAWTNINESARIAKQHDDNFWRLREKKKQGLVLTPQEQQDLDAAVEHQFSMVGGSVQGIKQVGKQAVGKVLTSPQAKETLKGLTNYTQDLVENFGVSPKAAQAMSYRDYITKADDIINNSKHVSDTWKQSFKDWVNTRAATRLEGILKGKEFKDLDTEGITGIIKFQAGDKTGRYGAVKQYFDDKYKELVKAKIDIGFKVDYLPQLYAGSDEQLANFYQKTLSKGAPFTLQSVFKNYQEAISAGLTPRYNNISQLVSWYEMRSNKLLADKKFMDYLKKEGFIQPSSTAPKFWKQISPDHFPKEKIKNGTETVIDTFSAPAEIADAVDNYLKDPEGLLSSFANLATRIKTAGLSAGVPFTSLNYHGASIFARSMLSASNPFSQLIKSGNFFLNPRGAQNYIQQNLSKAAFYTKHGLRVSAEDYDLIQELRKIEQSGIKGFGNKALTKYEEIFSDRLFNDTLPALKLNYTDELFKDLVKHMPEDQAARTASEQANNVFGGINLDQLFRKRETQNILRSTILAPDWLESTIKTGTGVAKGVLNPLTPEYKAYRVFARNFVLSYIALNVLNKAMSGHFMIENEGNNKFNLDTGTYTSDGKKRYVRPFAGSVDMFRLPQEIISGLAEGNPQNFFNTFKNRFSFPLAAGFHLASNQDFAGRPIYGKTRYGNPIDPKQAAGGITNEVLGGLGLPSQIRTGIDLTTGRINPEQAAMQLIEAPVKYEGGAYSKSQKERMATLQTAGFEGQELYESMKGETESKKSLFDGIASFFGLGKEDAATVDRNDPLLSALDKEIAGDEKANRIREIFKMKELDREGIEKVLEKENLGTYEEAMTTIAKSLSVENGNRGGFIIEYTKDMDDETKFQTYVQFAEQGILTNAVIDEWVDSGQMTEAEGKQYKNLVKYAKGDLKPKSGGRRATSVKSYGSVNLPNIPEIQYKSNPLNAKYRPTELPKLPIGNMIKGVEVRRAPNPATTFKSYGGK